MFDAVTTLDAIYVALFIGIVIGVALDIYIRGHDD